MKITPRKYAQALAQILEENKDAKPVIRNFLLLLRRKKQFRLLPKILKAFEDEWSSRHGIVRLNVTYPSKFKDAIAEFGHQLETALGKSVDMQLVPSETLIGGLRIHTADTLLDASLETSLKHLSQHLNN